MEFNIARIADENIRKDDQEKEFVIAANGFSVQVPYSDVQNDSGKLRQIMRLIEKDVPNDTIHAFYKMYLEGK